jgi:YHS domain-containing protein
MDQVMDINESKPETDKLIDPVCGMTVTEASEHRFRFEAVDYFFCCDGCRQKFSTDPAGYLSGEAQAAAAVPVPGALYICPMCPEVEEDHPASCPSCGMALEVSGPPLPATRTEYTCPMHPEVVQDSPGDCPKCGMALEPRTVEVEEKNEELIDMSRRFWIGLSFSLPVFALTMLADLAPSLLPQFLSMKTVSRALATATVPVDENRAVDRIPADSARGSVVRPAIFCTRLDLDQDSQPQHVYANRDRRRGCLRLQYRGAAATRYVSIEHAAWRYGAGLF